ncbi:MAG: hypothetical protein Tsb0034_13180 [Ekhidna sp.]
MFLASIEALESDWVSVGLLGIGAALNIALGVWKRHHPLRFYFNVIILSINTIIFLMIAHSYMMEGKQYLPYAWAVAALFSFINLLWISRVRILTKRD